MVYGGNFQKNDYTVDYTASLHYNNLNDYTAHYTTILNLEVNMKLKTIENRETEYKVKLDFKDNYQQWFKTFCAFANTDADFEV